jgi:hypothetical protein
LSHSLSSHPYLYEEEEGFELEEDEGLYLRNTELVDMILGLHGQTPRILIEMETPSPIPKYTRAGLDMYLSSYEAQPISEKEWDIRIDMQAQWSPSFPEDIWIFWRNLYATDEAMADCFIQTCESVGPRDLAPFSRIFDRLDQLAEIQGAANTTYLTLLTNLRIKMNEYLNQKEKKTLLISFSDTTTQRTITEAEKPPLSFSTSTNPTANLLL